MAQPSPQLNIPANDNPTITDLLNVERKRIKLELNCHAVAQIKSFDGTTQTARAQLAYQQTYFVFDQDTGTTTKKLVPYPLIIDAPVHVAGGGGTQGGALTFPYGAGDECLVCFNDRDIDNWFNGSTGGEVSTTRLHAFADAMILVGFRSLANVLPSYDASYAGVRNYAGTAVVGVQTSSPLALIKTATGGTLGTQIQNLCTQLQNLITAIGALTVTCPSGGGPSSPPINAASFTAVASSLTTVANALAEIIA